MTDEVQIRLWSPDDWPQLMQQIEQFLIANIARGGDMLPTARNVQFLLRMGMEAAQRGQPCLVAVEGSLVLGYIEWAEMNVPFDGRWRTCQAIGSFTRPDQRHRGISTALRTHAKAMCVAAGIERIMGPVHLTNDRGIRHFIETLNAWPTAVQMEAIL